MSLDFPLVKFGSVSATLRTFLLVSRQVAHQKYFQLKISNLVFFFFFIPLSKIQGVFYLQTFSHYSTEFSFFFLLDRRGRWRPTPVFLPRESCGQRSLGGCCPQGRTESDKTEVTQHACMHCRRKWQPTPIFLPGESQGERTLVGCRLWGHTESDTTEATQQQQQQQIALVNGFYQCKIREFIF